MQLRRPLLALGAGVATFGLVTVAVTEALVPRIEFSVLVGLPVGVAASALVGATIFLALGPSAGPTWRRDAATAVGLFGAVTLVAFASATALAGLRNSVALPVATAAGLLVGLAAYLWLRRSGPATARSTA